MFTVNPHTDGHASVIDERTRLVALCPDVSYAHAVAAALNRDGEVARLRVALEALEAAFKADRRYRNADHDYWAFLDMHENAAEMRPDRYESLTTTRDEAYQTLLAAQKHYKAARAALDEATANEEGR